MLKRSIIYLLKLFSITDNMCYNTIDIINMDNNYVNNVVLSFLEKTYPSIGQINDLLFDHNTINLLSHENKKIGSAFLTINSDNTIVTLHYNKL